MPGAGSKTTCLVAYINLPPKMPVQSIRKEPNSLNKLKKFDAMWMIFKLLLGWIVFTTTLTISLTTHRLEKFRSKLMESSSNQWSTYRRKWDHLVGILLNIVPALPGGGEGREFFPPVGSPHGQQQITLPDFQYTCGDGGFLVPSGLTCATPHKDPGSNTPKPTWNGTHDACHQGLGYVFWGAYGIP